MDKIFNQELYKQHLLAEKTQKVTLFENSLSLRRIQQLKYEDGSLYKGQLRSGHPQGFGIMYACDGSVYFGKWSDNKYHGKGFYIYPDGQRYQGELNYGRREGKGQFYYSNGSVYKGQWQDDQKSGEGQQIKASGLKYMGEWLNNLKNGKGVLYSFQKLVADGNWRDNQFGEGYVKTEYYQGSWRNNSRNGEGKYTFPDGSTYEGAWLNGEKHGHGIYRYPNGDYFEGEFKNGFRCGQGYYKYITGDHYEGEYQLNYKHGIGVMKFVNGDFYTGRWERDLYSGEGQFHFNNGEVLRGYFVNGAIPENTLPLISGQHHIYHIQHIQLSTYQFTFPCSIKIELSLQLFPVPNGVTIIAGVFEFEQSSEFLCKSPYEEEWSPKEDGVLIVAWNYYFCLRSQKFKLQLQQLSEQEMRVREVVEFVVFPKYFNALSFYAKGNYSVALKLCIQDPLGRVTSAYPVLFQGKDANLMQSKRASVSIENSTGIYNTQQFYITYNEESTILHTLTVFKVEYEKGVDYKTYLEVSLNLTRLKAIKVNELQDKKEKLVLETTKKVTNVDKRRIYINRHQRLNKFKRVTFGECEYFSFIDLYVCSVSLGQFLRTHSYQMIDFANFSIQQRRLFHLDTLEKSQAEQLNKGEYIRRVFFPQRVSIQEEDIVQFYNSNILRPILEYERLVSIYNGFRAKMFLLNNTSQLMQKINTPALHCLSHDGVTANSILSYYGAKNDSEMVSALTDPGLNCDNRVFMAIMEQGSMYRRNLLYIWQNLSATLLKMNVQVFETLIIQEIAFSDDFVKKSAILRNIQINPQIVDKERQQYIQRRRKVLNALQLYEDDDVYHPMVMIEGTDQSTSSRDQTVPRQEIDSLTVFVHGYQGSDYDLEKARNFMNLYNPNTYGLLIRSIQDEEDTSIEDLGVAVANQIKQHLAASSNNYSKINFIGYSLGGVLARESLKHLQSFKDRMNIFISFASPHLGIRNSENSLVSTGIWYLVNVSKVKTMQQLHCQPLANTDINTMKNLSACPGLGFFNKVILVSSKEDSFVPYYSSRMEETDNEELSAMCRSIKSRIKKLERVQVWFDVEHDINTWDKMIGRRAHIEFLENRGFLDSFFKIYGCQL